MKRIGKIALIIVGIGLISGIGWYISESTKTRPANISGFTKDFEMIEEYNKNFGKPVMKNEKKLLSENKDSIANLKSEAYFEGYGDYVVYGRKIGPKYYSEAFDGLSKKNRPLQEKLYKEMYKIGYQNAKK